MNTSISNSATACVEPSVALLELLKVHPRLMGLSDAERKGAVTNLSALASRLDRVKKISDSFHAVTLNPRLVEFMECNGNA